MTKSNANGSNATIIHMSLQGKGGGGKSLVAANPVSISGVEETGHV
jgi:hypothetical protein